MAPPSYESPGYHTKSWPTPASSRATHNPEPGRRRPQWQPFSNNAQSHQPSLSAALHFNPTSNDSHQSSPSLPSIFPTHQRSESRLKRAGEPTNNPSSDRTANLTLHNAFSPSMFNLSPSPFLTDPSLPLAPTPPSNPQYATFPFDTSHASLNAATHSALGGTGTTAQTPGTQSQTSGAHPADSETGNLEKDPFLSLLEQLAENEHSQGGPSELDFFLTGAVNEEGEGEEEGGGGSAL